MMRILRTLTGERNKTTINGYVNDQGGWLVTQTVDGIKPTTTTYATGSSDDADVVDRDMRRAFREAMNKLMADNYENVEPTP